MNHDTGQPCDAAARANLTLLLGMLAFLPVLGLFLGVAAALAGGGIRTRIRMGVPVRRQVVRRAAVGMLLGMIGILVNLVVGVVVLCISAMQGGAPRP